MPNTNLRCTVFEEKSEYDSIRHTRTIHPAAVLFNDWMAQNSSGIKVSSVQTHADVDGHVMSIVLFFEKVENDA